MNIKLDLANKLPDEALADYFRIADDVFLRSKHRSGSLLARFPVLSQKELASDVVLATVDQRAIGGATIRRFTISSGKMLRCAMLGFVCVSPEFRGKHVGQRLLEYASDELRRRNLDGCVLWTTLHAFYEQFGWRVYDDGLLGQYCSEAPRRWLSEMSSSDSERIERIRASALQERIERTARSYATVPPFVDATHCVFEGRALFDEAYALIGTNKDTCVVYEIVGSETCYSAIWDQLKSVRPNLIINQHAQNASFQWMRRNLPKINWVPQQQAMWLDCEMLCKELFGGAPNIPYFDRM